MDANIPIICSHLLTRALLVIHVTKYISECADQIYSEIATLYNAFQYFSEYMIFNWLNVLFHNEFIPCLRHK